MSSIERSASPRTLAGSELDASERPMIEADRLSKFYGIFAATRDVSFKVYKGEIVAFRPNAGKARP
jgi:ABC-2 type transport system ATP-binding protein